MNLYLETNMLIQLLRKLHLELQRSESSSPALIVVPNRCLYNALIAPHFDYCCEVWDSIGIGLSDRLQKLQNRAATVLTGRKNEHGQSELALNELGWKPLSERRTKFVASAMYITIRII